MVQARLLVLLKINTSVSACPRVLTSQTVQTAQVDACRGEETHFATHKYELPQGLPEKL